MGLDAVSDRRHRLRCTRSPQRNYLKSPRSMQILPAAAAIRIVLQCVAALLVNGDRWCCTASSLPIFAARPQHEAVRFDGGDRPRPVDSSTITNSSNRKPNGISSSSTAPRQPPRYLANNFVVRFRTRIFWRLTGPALAVRTWPPRARLDEQADAIAVLLTNEPPRKTILVGHSYGAPVALLAALKYTNQVAGVILIGGSVDPAQERTYAIQRIADWPLISWLVPRPLRQCNRELLTLRDDLVRLRPRLATLAVPVLMLHGGKDRQVPIANVGYLRAQLTTAGRANLFDQLVFPDYNHFIPWEHPGAVEAAIQKVAGRLDNRPHSQ